VWSYDEVSTKLDVIMLGCDHMMKLVLN
jgi:hypothetical protein